jgi:hypothetical protein
MGRAAAPLGRPSLRRKPGTTRIRINLADATVAALADLERRTMLVGAVLALVVVLLIACLNLETAAIGALLVATFTVPWNGVHFAGQRPGDVFIFVALMLFIASGVHRALPVLPAWTVQLGAVIVVVAVLHEMVPTDAHYLSQRVIIAGDGARTIEIESSLFVAVKFLVGVVGLPAAFCFAVQRRPEILRWLAIAFVAGVSVSSLVAFSDGRGLTSIGKSVTGVFNGRTREAGLTNHPNFLAASCIIALPLAMWLIVSGGRRTRIFGVITTFSIVLGTFASGSRGGAACLVLAIVATIALDSRFHHQIPTIVFFAGLATFVAFLVFPSFGHVVLNATRLTGGSSARGSDEARSIVATQGLQDFHHSPIDGVGFQVAAEATNVYVQELAAGGLLLFVGMQIYTLGGIRSAFMLRQVHDMASALLASLITAAVFNYVEADLTDRFYYVPTALVVAIASMRAAGREQLNSSPTGVARAPTPPLRRRVQSAGV